MMKNPNNRKISSSVRTVIAEVKKYIEKKLELLVLKAVEDISNYGAKIIQRTVGAAFLFLGLSFLLVALAIYLGQLLGIRSLGYVIVAVPLFGVGILFYFIQPPSLQKKVRKKFQMEFMESISYAEPSQKKTDHHKATKKQQETTENI